MTYGTTTTTTRTAADRAAFAARRVFVLGGGDDALDTIDALAEAEGSATPAARRAEVAALDDAWAGFDFDTYAGEFERRYDAGAY